MSSDKAGTMAKLLDRLTRVTYSKLLDRVFVGNVSAYARCVCELELCTAMCSDCPRVYSDTCKCGNIVTDMDSRYSTHFTTDLSTKRYQDIGGQNRRSHKYKEEV